MKDEDKTKEQLINELLELRQHISKMQASEIDRKDVEKALQKSEERFRQVAESSGEFIWEVDVNGLYTYASPVIEKILGYKPDEIIGKKHFYDFFHPDVRDTLKRTAFEVFAEKKHFKYFFNPNVHKNGNIVIFETNGLPVIDDKGNLLGYRGADRDVTKRKLAEEQIKQLNNELEQKIVQLTEINKALDLFNRSVSHDLQAPLTVVGGFAGRLLKLYGDTFETDAIDMINTIQKSAQKMERLIKDLLAFSRSARQEIKPVKINMTNLIGTVIDELKPLPEGRTVKFDIKMLAPAFGDIGLIKQVFTNLLSNAIKFTSTKKIAIVELGCRVEENENIYYVKDNGIGFDSQHTDKLFSPFNRLPEAKEYEGNGIGLSIVERIINRHGGRVWAEGKVNEGATFYFSLPIKVNNIQ